MSGRTSAGIQPSSTDTLERADFLAVERQPTSVVRKRAISAS